MTTQAANANASRTTPGNSSGGSSNAVHNNGSNSELHVSAGVLMVKAITSPHRQQQQKQRPSKHHRRRRRHSISTTGYRTTPSAMMDMSTVITTAVVPAERPVATSPTTVSPRKVSSPANAASTVAPMPRKSIAHAQRRTSFSSALSAMSLRGPTAVTAATTTAGTSSARLSPNKLLLQRGAEPIAGGSDARPIRDASPTSPSRVHVLEKQPQTAAAALIGGSTHRRRRSSTAATTPPRAELPILRRQYIARDVRVLLGTRWKLRKFETRTIVLRTSGSSSSSAGGVGTPVQPTLTLCATTPGDSNAVTLALPLALSCKHSGPRELKLKSAGGASGGAGAGTAPLRLKIRFATAADAAIWRTLVRDTLAHAQWTHRVDEVACLARGAAASVLLARDRASHQEFVVKVLPRVSVDAGACPELLVLRKVFASPLTAAALPHVREYRVVETPTDTRIVMPKLPGQTLLAFLQQQQQQSQSPVARNRSVHTLSERDARVVLQQLCDALLALHAAGVVHCDLKLENILLTDALSVRVIDFGGAYDVTAAADRPGSNSARRRHTTMTEQRQQHHMVGTPGYIAPERILFVDEPPTPAADVFSAGIILFQMLTGRQPFVRASRRHALTMQDTTTLHWPAAQQMLMHHGVSPAAIDLLARMVKSDPVTRISIAEVLTHEWLR